MDISARVSRILRQWCCDRLSVVQVERRELMGKGDEDGEKGYFISNYRSYPCLVVL
jgi:hypothetical protein